MFNTIHTKLQMDDDGLKHVADLVDKIYDIIFGMTFVGYEDYFAHVCFGAN